ncbi:MAG: hypothetical protein C0399_04040 [Syntrophus sp. (in: bacteria)]|nr:hypothetical protein [Syntrophus sp. (in: bacteria)]
MHLIVGLVLLLIVFSSRGLWRYWLLILVGILFLGITVQFWYITLPLALLLISIGAYKSGKWGKLRASISEGFEIEKDGRTRLQTIRDDWQCVKISWDQYDEACRKYYLSEFKGLCKKYNPDEPLTAFSNLSRDARNLDVLGFWSLEARNKGLLSDSEADLVVNLSCYVDKIHDAQAVADRDLRLSQLSEQLSKDYSTGLEVTSAKSQKRSTKRDTSWSSTRSHRPSNPNMSLRKMRHKMMGR